MASPDLPPPPSNRKDDEQGRGSNPDTSPKSEVGYGNTAKSTPPSSQNDTEATNKRKRDSADSYIDDNEDKISVNTGETGKMQVAGVKEVEMKDAEAMDESPHQGIKEVEMQDAEMVYNEEKSREIESKMHQNGSTEIETEQPTKLDEKRSIAADKSDGSGKESLGEVASLLKQVQESDAKAKLEVEVEVKVKKMDDGVVKENGEIEEAQGSAQVSCP